MSTRFIETCRDTQLSASEWLFALAETAAPVFGQNHGLAGYTYRVLADGTVAIVDLIYPRGSELAQHPEYGKANFLEHINRSPVRALFAAPQPSAVVLSRLERRWFRDLAQHLPPKCSDSVGMMGGAHRGEGIHLCALSRDPLDVDLRRTRYLARLATHLSAGHRVRRILLAAEAELDQVAAVMTPDGRLAHVKDAAISDARTRVAERLVAAVRNSERLCVRSLRHSVSDADALAEAFVAGRYAWVDQLDTDGKRWVVVVRVDGAGVSALSTRERRVAAAAAKGLSNKAIASELGISTRAVAYDLRSCLSKLGLVERSALVRWFHS